MPVANWTDHGLPDPGHATANFAERAIELASQLLRESAGLQTRSQRRSSRQIAKLIADEHSKRWTLDLVDQVLRITEPQHAADRLAELNASADLSSLGWLQQNLLRLAAVTGRLVPRIVLPAVRHQIRRETEHVILPAESERLDNYLRSRQQHGWRVNLNVLGEAVLGHREAARRLETYRQHLANPAIDYVSVKLSSIDAHISLTGYEATIRRLAEKLQTLYRDAIAARPQQPKFVSLDMEEYRDLHLTVDVFRRVLDQPEFHRYSAGIVLQAYLPDAFAVLRSLTDWASQRFHRGGAVIKVRIVKGANLAAERVEASLQGWPLATFGSKRETDANYKRMLQYALRPEHAAAVRVGVASHNLFDIAAAINLTRQNGVRAAVDFEMLEGMANAQAEAVHRRSKDLLVYAPICHQVNFEAAIAYLVRRFDENTQPGNFLKELFDLRVDSPAWKTQASAFRCAWDLSHSDELSDEPNRSQDRGRECPLELIPNDWSTTSPAHEEQTAAEDFRNEPNTDFALPANRRWLADLVDTWRDRQLDDTPLQIGGHEIHGINLQSGIDPSRPERTLYRWSAGRTEDVDTALSVAQHAVQEWSDSGLADRASVLRRFADLARKERGIAIARMMADGGKVALEADAEVSEAIDFANYYAMAISHGSETAARRNSAADVFAEGTVAAPLGVVVVTPPWNFPYAIPAGGCLAALAAGNSVILKPAPETVAVAWLVADQLWRAGVPREVLQFLPLADGEVGRQLICDPRTAAVILTGSYATAEKFLTWRPQLNLLAETSGKNSLIISDAADVDLAIKDLVKGAFGHAGQKCSASSLAIVHRSLLCDAQFREQLADAVESLVTDSPWNLEADVPPVIRPPHPELHRGLTQLDAGESWLLRPNQIGDNPRLWQPGIRLGIQPDSWYAETECFGPVLGIIEYSDFGDAIAIQNSSQFGLTGGLHSLDPGEIECWQGSVGVGNAYINRTTTGAIVQRQPFGGWKRSAIGSGAKAGGPNYVASLSRWRNDQSPTHRAELPAPTQAVLERWLASINDAEERRRVTDAAASFQHWWQAEFSREHDPSGLWGESNRFRYRPLAFHCARVDSPMEVSPVTLALIEIASSVVGIATELSLPPGTVDQLAAGDMQIILEDEHEFVKRLAGRQEGSVRLIGARSSALRAAVILLPHRVVDTDVLDNGRVELLKYLHEQSLSETTHRHGNVRPDHPTVRAAGL